MAATTAPTVGSWVHYCGSRTELRGEIFEVIAVYSTHVRLQGIWGQVFCRAESVRVACP